MAKNFMLGALEIGVGLFLASPADEALVTAGTGGVGAAAAPAQLPLTAIIGAALCYDGLKRL